MTSLAARARDVSGNRLPLWNLYMPTASTGRSRNLGTSHLRASGLLSQLHRRAMGGPPREDTERQSLPERRPHCSTRPGTTSSFPTMDTLCCGQAFESKGLWQADRKAGELSGCSWQASRNGTIPVLCDTSPCLHRIKQTLTNGSSSMNRLSSC